MRNIFIPLSLALLLCAQKIIANPYSPNAFPVLSEIQLADTGKYQTLNPWTIEIFPYENYIQYGGKPKYADTVVTDYYLNASNGTKPKIRFNSKGYGLITDSDYPLLKLKPGDTVTLYDSKWPNYTWRCGIDSSLKKSQSMACILVHWYDSSSGGPFHVQSLFWHVDSIPSIGAANTSYSPPVGMLAGVVKDKHDVPIPNVSAICNSQHHTDGDGKFLFVNLFAGRQYSVRVFIPGTPTINKYFYSTPIEANKTVNLDCKLDSFELTTAIKYGAESDRKPAGIIKSIHQIAGRVFVTISNIQPGVDCVVAIYALSGRKMFETSIAGKGEGTYAVAWDGRDISGSRPASGAYILRVANGNTSFQKQFSLPP
jgi:hypothetical protein